jgi:hypothetical protein
MKIVLLLIFLISFFFVISESFAQEGWKTFRIAGEFYLPNGKTDYQIQEIPYTIQNGTITGIDSKLSSNNISISIEPIGNGLLEIKIPRNIADATIRNQMDEFFILLNQKEVDFKEKTLESIDALCYRHLEISFSKHTSVIEIIGTNALGFPGLNVFPYYPIECLASPSPKLQIKSGIASEDVVCNEDLKLVIKSSDNSPACVNQASIEKLIQRGWASNALESKSDSEILQFNPVLFKGTGVNLKDEGFTSDKLLRLEYLEKDLERLLDDPNVKREDQREYYDDLEKIQLYAQLAFDKGVSWELIEILWEEDKKLTEIISNADRNRYPITGGGGISIGVNAYSMDEDFVGKPTALRVDILKEKFTKETLIKTDKMIRESFGNEIDIIYSKGGYISFGSEDN